jgi:2-keto-3-deoxy-L-rhamnonate aldolase RhmA
VAAATALWVEAQMTSPVPGRFRRRFTSREPLLGTFLKTPSSHNAEILGSLGFDFLIVDAEHAPFDRGTIDAALLGARAAACAAIVRVAEPSPTQLLAALDDGAAGVMVPHVSSAERAQEVVRACRYVGGRRGFSNSPRAGGYGAVGLRRHIEEQDAGVTVIAMIEDPEALGCLDAIIATDGLDGVFVGRADLAVAMNEASVEAPAVTAAAEKVIAAAARAGKPACVMTSSSAEAQRFRAGGATSFVISSDQAFMRQAAQQALNSFASVRN